MVWPIHDHHHRLSPHLIILIWGGGGGVLGIQHQEGNISYELIHFLNGGGGGGGGWGDGKQFRRHGEFFCFLF